MSNVTVERPWSGVQASLFTHAPAAPTAFAADSRRAAFDQFDAWARLFSDASEEGKRSLEPMGLALAQDRRHVLEQLIQEDPESALQQAVPDSVRRRLPVAIQEQLEEPVSGWGDLSVIARVSSPGAQDASAPVMRYLNMGNRQFHVFTYGARSLQPTQQHVAVRGIALGDSLALHQDAVRVPEAGQTPTLPVANADGRCPISGLPVNPLVTVECGGQTYRLCCGDHAQDLNRRVLASAQAPSRSRSLRFRSEGASSWSTGPKTVLFMVVRLSDQVEMTPQAGDFQVLMNDVNSFMNENSFGQISFQTTITPVLQLSDSTSAATGDPIQVLDDARAAARAAGYDTDSYDLDCVYGGVPGVNQAFVGGKGAWLSSLDQGLACHEFGHNLGLFHANAWVTDDGTSIGNGTNQEYGNKFDTMGWGGWGAHAFNAFERHSLGWLPDTAVTSFSASGLLQLSPIDTPALADGATYALRIPKDSERDYWVEFRQHTPGPDAPSRVLVTWSPWGQSNGGSQLLRCNPAADGEWALQTGVPFYDLERGVKLELLDAPVMGDAASVRVTQVHYLPVQLSGPVDSSSGLATVSTVLKVPEDGDYWIWARSGGQSGALPGWLSIADQQGEIAPVDKDTAEWRRVLPPLTTSVDPQPFHLSAGEQVVQVPVRGSAGPALQLLVTNDAATNLPPVLSEVPDQIIPDDRPLVLNLSAMQIGADASTLVWAADRSDVGLIPGLKLEPTADGETLSLTPNSSRIGTATITVTATDSSGRRAVRTFAVTLAGPGQYWVNSAAAGATVRMPSTPLLGPIIVDKDLILEGTPDSSSVIDGRNHGVALTVNSNCTVVLRRVHVRNGLGGGIRNFGTLHVVAGAVESNHGSGIYNNGALLVEGSVIANNHAVEAGGLDNRQSASLFWTSISSNVVQSQGGGIANRSGANLTCESCSLVGNQSTGGNGGAIANTGQLALANSTVCENDAETGQTDDKAKSQSTGGGIFNSGSLFLKNVTLCRNRSQATGGLANQGQAEMLNTLVAQNVDSAGHPADCSGSLLSDGHNLIQDTAHCTIAGTLTGNILGQDPRLGSLQTLGNGVPAVPLLPDSPAIGAGDGTLAENIDQWGRARLPLASDIGALQFQQGGGPGLVIQLRPGQLYRVEASSDLINWTPIGLYDSGANGHLVMPQDTVPVRFYRAVVE
jgi:hypothetical protein